MQLPSFIVLLRYLEFLLHAHVPGTLSYTWDEPFQIFFLYFMIYAGSTVVFQVCQCIATLLLVRCVYQTCACGDCVMLHGQ